MVLQSGYICLLCVLTGHLSHVGLMTSPLAEKEEGKGYIRPLFLHKVSGRSIAVTKRKDLLKGLIY